MTGQVARNIENLRTFANEGLTYCEAAARLDICVPYVKVLAKTHGIVLALDPTLSAERIEQIKFASPSSSNISFRRTRRFIARIFWLLGKFCARLSAAYLSLAEAIAPDFGDRK